jgi:hypothetical protein
MGPLGFLTGIVLGSAAAIALVLVMVVVIFAVSAAPGGATGREYPELLATAGLFALLATVSAIAFVGLQRERRWRWLAQAAMWSALAGIAWYYGSGTSR